MFSGKNGKPPYRRGYKRIRLGIKVGVSGQDGNGSHFQTDAVTVNVSGKGCCLCLDRDLVRGQPLSLTSPKGIVFTVRVCWSQYSPLRDVRLAGVSLPTFTTGWVIADQTTLI